MFMESILMKKMIFAASAVGLFVAGSAFAQTAEIGTWSGFRKGAASFTFDDGAPSHVSDGGPLFDKYGYKATFNVVVNWNPDWSGFGNMAKNGQPHFLRHRRDSRFAQGMGTLRLPRTQSAAARFVPRHPAP